MRLISYTGSISFRDTQLDKINVRELRKKVCYVPQIPEMFPGSVESNILWARSIWKLSIPENYVRDLLEMVDLDDSVLHKDANDLSVGQKQRVCLARSLALEPEVLLLDEPDSALDAISRENFELLIKNLKEKNSELTLIMVTHDLHQASRIADYVILLDKGKIISEGDSNTFFSSLESQSESDLLKKLINNKGGQ